MHFNIRPDAPIPIFQQIVSQIIYFIASGAIDPGDSIPSVRDLGEQLTVNPNTVARAYQILTEKGILQVKRGLGMEVTTEAPAICRSHRQDLVRDRIRDALREAVASALPAQEVEHIVAEELHRVNGHRK
jgi:GntR family transcriptional regulator